MTPAQIVVVAADAAIAAGLGWWFLGPKKTADAADTGGVQELRVTVKGGYSPNRFRVLPGIPVQITFDRQESGDCTSKVVFSDSRSRRTCPPSPRPRSSSRPALLVRTASPPA